MIIKPTNFLRKQYKLVKDSYEGQGGFATGEYIFKFPRELDYESRLEQASYTNYIKPIVDSTIDPVFSEKPKRQYNDEPIVEAFLNNCDNNKTNLSIYIKEAVLNTALNANHFIVMDNFTETPESLEEILNERAFPYIYTKSLSDVYEAEVDDFGKLISITFRYGIYDEEKNLYLYREFKDKTISSFTIDDKGKKIILTEVINGLQIIPIIYHNKDILPFSPYYSLATIARQIYNQDSRVNDLDTSSDFNILIIPSTNPGSPNNKSIVTGNHNALFVDSESKVLPQYISADSSTLKTSLEYKSSTVNTLLQIADVLGSSAVVNGGNKAESGVALSYRFYGKMAKLIDNASIAEFYEKSVIYLLGLFIGIDVDYDVDYISNLRPSMNEVLDKVQLIERVSGKEISNEITDKLNYSLIEIVGSALGWNDEDINELLETIPRKLD